MAKAITYNNAGVVEAIKRNSGSTKFYKASYQGIIEAIEDWGGGSTGGGTSVLPGGGSLPGSGNEGDLVVIPNGDGDYFMYVYANGQWERLHITTEEVETAGSAPFALVTDDGVTVKNQKEINAYLDQRITALSEKGYDDTGIKADLAKEVTDRTEGDQALQDQINALEGYDDATIKAELAQEVTDRTEGDQALQDQIDALEAYDDTGLSQRIDSIEEGIETALGVQEQIIDRVQELPTWISEVPPVDKQEGDLWFDSGATGQLYVRYGEEWVVACPPVTDEDLAGTVSDVEAVAQTALQKANLVEYSLYQQGELLKWDQERQDNQIYELEEEIESLAPSFDRGKWQLVEGERIGPGQYAMAIGVDSQYCQDQYMKCLAEAEDESAKSACLRLMGDCEAAATEGDGEVFMNDWAHARSLHFSTTDVDGKEHSFADYSVGKFIDLFDQDDTGFAVFEITEEPVIENGIAIIAVTPIQHEGEASGVARLKVFQAAEIDTSSYVRKTGDTITGPLRLYPESTNNPLTIQANNEGDTRSTVVNVRGMAGEDGTRASIFSIVADGRVNIDDDVPITSKWQVPHKKYVDESCVSKKGDVITGFTQIKPGEGEKAALYLQSGPAALSGQVIFRVADQQNKSVFYTTEEGKIGVKEDYSATSDNHLTNKKYVDKAIADAIKNIQFPAVAEPGPAQLCWEYRKPASGKGPADGTFWLDSNHFRISMKTKNGVNLAYGYPSGKDEWWFPAADKYGGRALMTVWKKYSSGWKFFNHYELDKTRWVLTTDGITHFQFRKDWDSHKLSFGTGTTYYITVGGFF